MSAEPTWDEVLSAVEADIAGSELALAPYPVDPRSGSAPALLHLPVASHLTAPGPDLPPLDQLTDVPADARDRIAGLQRRIDVLQQQLRVEMAEVRSALVAPLRPHPTSAQLGPASAVPRLFDSRI